MSATAAETYKTSLLSKGDFFLYYPTMVQMAPGTPVHREPGYAPIAFDNPLEAMANALVGDQRVVSVSNHDNKDIFVILVNRTELAKPASELKGYIYPVLHTDSFSRVEGSGHVADKGVFVAGGPAIVVTPKLMIDQGIQVFTLNDSLTPKQWYEMSHQPGIDPMNFIVQACQQGLLNHENQPGQSSTMDLNSWQQRYSQPQAAVSSASAASQGVVAVAPAQATALPCCR